MDGTIFERFAGHPADAGVVDFTRSEVEACREMLERIVEGDAGDAPETRTPENTLVPLNDLHIRLENLWHVLGLMRSVHPEASLRRACEQAEQEAARFANELALDRGLYEAVNACSDEDSGATVPSGGPRGENTVGRRYRRRLIRDFHRAGVDRDDATRGRIRALREELVTLGQEFTRNIVTDTREILLDGADELEGLPEDYIHDHPPGAAGKIRITTDYPDYNPFMAYAESGRRRRELYVAFRRRAHPANLAVLDRIFARRYELATLLGYPSWAAYASEDKMIKTSEAIGKFIARVTEVSGAEAEREYATLLEQKRKRAATRGEVAATEVFDWEKSYLEEQVKAEKFKVDSKEVRAYFEYGNVRDGLLGLTERLFGVRFVPVADAARWHRDVDVLDVFEDGSSVGRIYLDMHPREGKFKHAAMFPVASGVRGKQLPQAALVCNFPDPTSSRRPALLEHDDVVTFFHEFGHLIHHLFARDLEWAEFSGTSTEWDFIEVPSQLYEEWAWDYDVLKDFALHHATGEPIPRDLVHGLRAARDFGRGLWVRHQMFYAAVSHECYRGDPAGMDTTELMRTLQNAYSKFAFVDGTYFQSSFGHLVDYSALYYTYMWSLVIVKDIYRQLKKAGTLDPAVAARYRESILSPGGSRDAADLVRDFLGRDYSFKAFERWIEGRA